ncbi:MAG: arginyltransferase [Gammaproteobacteria bacterium]|nr:arginyltransferase [Gammaproteobacteria bacterium]MCP5135174.1 arginyltransferase [Gammaproteobacteria bacterium]
MTESIPPRLAFYATHEHPCSYLAGKRSVTLFADPTAEMTNEIYGGLAELGFRRSGSHVYRPACNGCRECVPIRVPVAGFRSNRAQRRVWNRNRDLEISFTQPSDDKEHFDLYRRYQRSRHPGGGMDDDDPERYLTFLSSPWCKTEVIEFRLDGRLVAAAVVDRMPQGLSAVYTYFDTTECDRSLGTLAVLQQMKWARELELSAIYLGYWIAESAKMNYKTAFRPYELFVNGAWRRFDDHPHRQIIKPSR